MGEEFKDSLWKFQRIGGPSLCNSIGKIASLNPPVLRGSQIGADTYETISNRVGRYSYRQTSIHPDLRAIRIFERVPSIGEG